MRTSPRRTPLRLSLLALLALPLLLAATKPPPRAGARSMAQKDASARKALERVTERYRTLKGYHLEGRGESRMTSTQGDNVTVTSVRFLVSRPDRHASEVQAGGGTTRLVSNGDSVWTAVPEMGQYLVQSLAFVKENLDSAGMARQFDPAAIYGALLQDAVDVQAKGRDTVHTADGVVTCDRYAVISAKAAQVGEGVVMHPRYVWVDPATRLVLLDSVRVDQQHAQLGDITSVNITRMAVARPDPAFGADAFVFRDGGDLKRVRRFMRRSPEHSSLEGRPAADFTLETLGDGTPVKLSDQKGSVVLLDFWATWCGPCRGWMPIVAKAHREYGPKGLKVYAVNERETETKVRAYLDKQKIDVPVLMDRSGAVGTMYKANSIPLTVVVGRDGNVVRVLVGLHGEEDLKDVLAEAGLL